MTRAKDISKILTDADISGNIDVDGVTNLDVVDIDGALTQDGGAVFNEASADVDFRVESNGNANMLFVDGGNDRIGIGTNSPQKLLHLKDGDIVVGNGTASNNAVIGRIGFSTDSSNSRFIGMESFRGGDAANGDLRFHTFGGDGDNGERVRIHTNGVLSASDGIALGVGTANTASNVLDDYEVGNFTPVLDFGGGTTGISYSLRTGSYTKIGNIVNITIRMLLQNKGSSTGASRITGLPFTTSSASQHTASTYNDRLSAIAPQVYNNGNTTQIQFYENRNDGTNNSAITNSAFHNTTFLIVSMQYFV